MLLLAYELMQETGFIQKETDLGEIARFLDEELRTGGRLQDYRWLHHCAIQRGFVVSGHSV